MWNSRRGHASGRRHIRRAILSGLERACGDAILDGDIGATRVDVFEGAVVGRTGMTLYGFLSAIVTTRSSYARALERRSVAPRGWLCVLVLLLAACASARAAARPWDDASLAPERRAQLALEAMTQSEKLSWVHGGLGAPWGHEPKPAGAIGSAGYVPGTPRLGIPALQETDAELGVANPGNIRRGDTATAMPSNLAMASSFDVDLARRQGEAVGAEARAKGFNVVLGGASDLIRDPAAGATSNMSRKILC